MTDTQTQTLTDAIDVVRQINQMRKDGTLTPDNPLYNFALLVEAAEEETKKQVIIQIEQNLSDFFINNWKMIIVSIVVIILIYKK